jgi:hypothetical protein
LGSGGSVWYADINSCTAFLEGGQNTKSVSAIAGRVESGESGFGTNESNTTSLISILFSSWSSNKHYKHLQLFPERKCKIGMGKTYTQFYKKIVFFFFRN